MPGLPPHVRLVSPPSSWRIPGRDVSPPPPLSPRPPLSPPPPAARPPPADMLNGRAEAAAEYERSLERTRLAASLFAEARKAP